MPYDLELLDTTRLWWSDDVDCRIYQEALIGNLDWYLLTGHIAVKVATARQAATLAVGVRDRWIVQLEDRPYSVGDVPPGLAEYYDGPQEEPFK